MSARRPPPPIPVTILTGFLGAGKTSLLNRLLSDPTLARTLALVNEFGEIGLDHLLVERSDDSLIVLASGCLCCTIRGALVDTLEDVLRRLDNGRMDPIDRIVIETTGLADPAPILETFLHHPYFLIRFQIDGVITMVDALNVEATLDAQAEASSQIAVADHLIVTKLDLLPPSERAATRARLIERLRALNPAAAIADADDPALGPESLFGLAPGAFPAQARLSAWLGVPAPP